MQVPLSDEAVAVRVAELVDGVMRQLFLVWDRLEPVALGGSGMVGAGAALQMPSDASSGESKRGWFSFNSSIYWLHPTHSGAG